MTHFTKSTLRREAKERRDRIEPGDAPFFAVIPHFMEALKPQAGQAMALYCARGGEFDPAPLAEALRERGCRIALPVITPRSRILRFALWRDGDPLDQGPFGIAQPPETPQTVWVDPAIVAVPLLAFDARGNRLGHGGGYYDATLHALRLHGPALAVGLAYAEQKAPDRLPVEPHDVPLDWIVTPEGAHCFISS